MVAVKGMYECCYSEFVTGAQDSLQEPVVRMLVLIVHILCSRTVTETSSIITRS